MTRAVAEINTFITLLRVASEEAPAHAALTRLLSLTGRERGALVHAWVTDLLIERAPHDFVEAIACLADDAVAAQARRLLDATPKPPD